MCFKEVKRGLKAGVEPVVRKLDMVSREEFDIQKRVLAKLHERLDRPERRLDAFLESDAEPGSDTVLARETKEANRGKTSVLRHPFLAYRLCRF